MMDAHLSWKGSSVTMSRTNSTPGNFESSIGRPVKLAEIFVVAEHALQKTIYDPSLWTLFSSLEEYEQKYMELSKAAAENYHISWLGSLTSTIIGNLKISIGNVHIRYEDYISNPGHPFVVGITLANLAAFNVDEQGNETFTPVVLLINCERKKVSDILLRVQQAAANVDDGERSCKPLPICDDQLYLQVYCKRPFSPFEDESKPIHEVIEWIESEFNIYFNVLLVLDDILRLAWLQLVLKFTKDLTPFHHFKWLDVHVLFGVSLDTSYTTNELSKYCLHELELMCSEDHILFQWHAQDLMLKLLTNLLSRG
ncbi:trafficking protein particle complex II-specific subunit 130 [Tanacetum coccineum]